MAKNEFFSLIYSPEKIEWIKSKIIQAKQQDALIPYEILIDYSQSLGKQIELTLLSSYEQFLTPQTKTISFRIYHHSGNHSGYETYCLYLNPHDYLAQTKANQTINGLHDLDTLKYSPISSQPIIDEQALKEKWLKEQRQEELESMNAALTNQIKELESVIIHLQTEKDDIKRNRDLKFGGIAKIFIDQALTNPNITKKFPQIEALSGIFKTLSGSEEEGTINETAHSNPTEEGNITFKRKSSTSDQNNTTKTNNSESQNEEQSESDDESIYDALPSHDKELIQFFHNACEVLNEADYLELMQLVQVIVEHPKAIHFLSKQVTNYIRQIKTGSQGSTPTH